MRVHRTIARAAAGVAACYVASLVAALWLRAAVSHGDFVWNAISPFRIAAWFVTSAYAVPLVVRSAAGVNAPDAPASIGSLSELLGGRSDVVFSFQIVLIPLTLLAAAGIATALLVRRANPSSARDVARWSACCALTHAVALVVLARLSAVEFVLEGDLAPELGLGAATGRVAIGFAPHALLAIGLGAGWGAAFAAAGGMSALPMRRTIEPNARALLLGWMNGLGIVAAAVACVLAVGAVGAFFAGRAPGPPLVGLGGYLLAANAVAAGILFAHGIPMAVALDAGPFTGWERMDLFNMGVGGDALPPPAWLVVVVPLAAGAVGGRFVRRRSTMTPAGIAVRFGALWGLSLAMLALLLRVRVLSSFSVGALDLGGGSTGFDPLIALAFGFAWATVSAFGGAASVTASLWTCASCGMSNAQSDRFCVSCGSRAGTEVQPLGSQPGA